MMRSNSELLRELATPERRVPPKPVHEGPVRVHCTYCHAVETVSEAPDECPVCGHEQIFVEPVRVKH